METYTMRRLDAVTCGGFCASALMLFASPASAKSDEYANPDRPGIADGSTVIGPGKFQIETGLQREYRDQDGGSDHRVFTPTLLRFGLTDQFEARVETNGYSWARTSTAGAVHSEGLAPVSMGFKYQLLTDQGAARPSIGAIARVFPASGSHGFGTNHTTGDLRLAADFQLADHWSLNPNVGAAVYEDDQGHTFAAGLFALTLDYSPNHGLNLFVDAGAQGPEARHQQAAAIIDAGAAYMITRDLQVDVSVGTRLAGETPPHPFLAAGISRRF